MMRRVLPLVLLATLGACKKADNAAADSAGATAAAAPSTAAAPATTTDSAAGATAAAPGAQGAQGALLDPNAATKEQLTAVPGLTPAAADALIAGRPYADMAAFNTVLAKQVADSAARVGVYRRVFKPLDLNTAKDEEILLIPGVGRRMLREFKEYRPYKNIDQFRREIGKYVSKEQVAEWERYVTIK